MLIIFDIDVRPEKIGQLADLLMRVLELVRCSFKLTLNGSGICMKQWRKKVHHAFNINKPVNVRVVNIFALKFTSGDVERRPHRVPHRHSFMIVQTPHLKNVVETSIAYDE